MNNVTHRLLLLVYQEEVWIDSCKFWLIQRKPRKSLLGAGGCSASGKYQYVSGTWKARASLAGPAGQYTSAGQAPEEVQDAVAYIEYTQVFNSLGETLQN